MVDKRTNPRPLDGVCGVPCANLIMHASLCAAIRTFHGEEQFKAEETELETIGIMICADDSPGMLLASKEAIYVTRSTSLIRRLIADESSDSTLMSFIIGTWFILAQYGTSANDTSFAETFQDSGVLYVLELWCVRRAQEDDMPTLKG